MSAYSFAVDVGAAPFFFILYKSISLIECAPGSQVDIRRYVFWSVLFYLYRNLETIYTAILRLLLYI